MKLAALTNVDALVMNIASVCNGTAGIMVKSHGDVTFQERVDVDETEKL